MYEIYTIAIGRDDGNGIMHIIGYQVLDLTVLLTLVC